jgi:uncharacterized protein DUF2752
MPADRRPGRSGGACGPANRLALTWGAIALTAVLLAPLATQLAALLPGCLFRDLTGLPCPTCGTAHAALAIAHLDLSGAFAINPLATLGALLFLLGGAAAAAASLAGRPLREPRLSGPVPRLAALLAVAANWAWLLLHPPPA